MRAVLVVTVVILLTAAAAVVIDKPSARFGGWFVVRERWALCLKEWWDGNFFERDDNHAKPLFSDVFRKHVIRRCLRLFVVAPCVHHNLVRLKVRHITGIMTRTFTGIWWVKVINYPRMASIQISPWLSYISPIGFRYLYNSLHLPDRDHYSTSFHAGWSPQLQVAWFISPIH